MSIQPPNLACSFCGQPSEIRIDNDRDFPVFACSSCKPPLLRAIVMSIDLAGRERIDRIDRPIQDRKEKL
jgi:hypothetical protein